MNKVKKISVVFHEDIERHKDAVKVPIAMLHQFIQDKIVEYKEKYNLFTFNANIWFHMNEYFVFFYLKDIDGVNCRIDFEFEYQI